MAAPVFVKIDKYSEVIAAINNVKSKLEEAKSALKKITDLKNEEDAEIRDWQEELRKIEERVSSIKEELSSPEQQ
jgi:predicted nuclease with TOPRIM domain